MIEIEQLVRGSFNPCDVEDTCDSPMPWAISWTATIMHASWDPLFGNMLFLAFRTG